MANRLLLHAVDKDTGLTMVELCERVRMRGNCIAVVDAKLHNQPLNETARSNNANRLLVVFSTQLQKGVSTYVNGDILRRRRGERSLVPLAQT